MSRLWDVVLINGEAIAGCLPEDEARNIAMMYNGVTLPSSKTTNPMYRNGWYDDKIYQHLVTLGWFDRVH